MIKKCLWEGCAGKGLAFCSVPLRSTLQKTLLIFFFCIISLHCEKTIYSSFSHSALIEWLYGVRGYSPPCGVSIKKNPIQAPLRFGVVFYSAPCGLRSPSSLHAYLLHSASLHYIGLHFAYLSAPLLGADFRFISSASAPLLPVFIGFHFHFRGFVTPLRSAHAPTGIPSAHTRSLSIAFPSPSSLALTGALLPHTIPEAFALPYAFIPYSAPLHIV